MGYIENAYIGDSALELSAKLDTGADASSVFAEDIKIKRAKDGQRWVSFRLTGEDGRVVRYNTKLIRFTRVKLKTGGTVKRPVVSMRVCVGGVSQETIVNLADRSDFNHPMLIGREFLSQNIAVTAGDTHLAEDSCHAASADNSLP